MLSSRPVSPRRSGSPLRPLGLPDVVLDPDGFWGAAQRRNGEVTIPHAEHWIEHTGAPENFLPPDERSVRERRGALFTDSDVHKVLEAMAWEAARAADPDVGRRLERLSAIVARAQEPDGYLNTYWGAYEGRERYSDLQMGHELYCAGHLIQAAVAAARTGGPATLVELGRAVADHVCRESASRGLIDGHPEIEPALVELYRLTGEQRYLDTARAMVERRGRGLLGDGPFGPAYYQDDVPVREARVMRGHAVRALYLLAGAVDVAVETGDGDLLAAVARQWDATIARRTYITGGMGSRHEGEAFGDDFELPTDSAYSETCAGVAAVMLAWRLLLATGEVRYADQIERTLHNVVLAGVSRDGDAFFYTNPLEVRPPATAERVPWFWCPCCPPNVARLLASLGAYVATTDGDGVQLHLYAAGTVRTGVAALAVRTGYPWDGRVEIEVQDTRAEPWTLSLRVPAWAQGATVAAGGAPPEPAAPGVVRLRRAWSRGDVVRLELAVAPRFTAADPRVEAVRGCLAVERGPLVYCAEALDGADLASVSVDTAGARDCRVEGLEGVVGIAIGAGDRTLTLVPYHLWANRGPSAMRVWLRATALM